MRIIVIPNLLALLATFPLPVTGQTSHPSELPPAILLDSSEHSAPERSASSGKTRHPTIKLGEKQLDNEPRRSGVGVIHEGKSEAKVKENQLLTLITGGSAAHRLPAFPHSDFLSTVQLTQEFEVKPASSRASLVELSMGGRIDGYLRAENKGAAHLVRADAVLTPACGGPCINLAFPPAHVVGNAVFRCKAECQSDKLVAPGGKYILVVTLMMETTADGLFRGHAEAVFAPGAREGSWITHTEEEPPSEEDAEDFGLAITVRADPVVPD